MPSRLTTRARVPLLAAWCILFLACGAGAACQRDAAPGAVAPVPADDPAASGSPRRIAGGAHLTPKAGGFFKEGSPFAWRGVTAFRLAEMIAHGREGDAVTLLDWAASRKLTVVRVLLMARHLFQLDPADGVRAAPRLLELAAERGLHVELVALADTAAIRTDLAQHVSAVGAVAAAHANALVEIANEPWHPSQDARLHDPSFTGQLAERVPAPVPVALGSVEGDPGYAEGSYVTWHAPRGSGQDGWQHVLQLADGAALVSRWARPVISDEPIGAHTDLIAGRRDNLPARFAAAAVLTRTAGLGATFHYEDGLQAQVPSGRALECFEAWQAGLDLMADLPEGGRFIAAGELAAVAGVQRIRAAFGREYGDEVWLAAIDPADGASVTFRDGWRPRSARRIPGVHLHRARR